MSSTPRQERSSEKSFDAIIVIVAIVVAIVVAFYARRKKSARDAKKARASKKKKRADAIQSFRARFSRKSREQERDVAVALKTRSVDPFPISDQRVDNVSAFEKQSP